jgi:hypothetical protein
MALTLFGFVAERLMEKVCDLLEDIRVDFLLCFLVEENDFHRPVAEGEAFNTTVCAGTADEVNRQRGTSDK